MKPYLYTLLLFFACSAVAAQSPTFLNYQAVVRDAAGAVVASQPVTVAFNVHEGSADGPVVFAISPPP